MEQYRTTCRRGYCLLFSLSLSCVWLTKYAVTIPLNYSVTLEKVVELFHSYLMGPRTHYDIGHAWFKSYCFIPSVASVWYSAIRNNIYWRQAVRQIFQLVRTGSGSHPASYSVDIWESTIPTAVLPHSDQDTARPLSTALSTNKCNPLHRLSQNQRAPTVDDEHVQRVVVTTTAGNDTHVLADTCLHVWYWDWGGC